MPVRIEAVYVGRVQCVGFRYTVCEIARRYPVAGFVRNRPDGTVELVAEGEDAAILEFRNNIHSRFSGHIQSESVDQLPSTGEFEGFHIRD